MRRPMFESLILMLEVAFRKQAWHGPNLRGSLRGVTAGQALWRPSPERHSIWELTLHTAYWKYAVRRRLTNQKRGSFPREGSNWFRPPEEASQKSWANDVQLLVNEHKLLISAVQSLQPADLNGDNLRYIHGAAMHDVYHAGQITLLKRLQRV
jgi:hypothetical protein